MPENRRTIREAVADQLNNLSDRTRSAVVEHFAAIEATKQANAIVAGLSKLSEMERDLKKIKPVAAGYDEEGKPVGDVMFTKDQVEQRKKLNEQMAKLVKAVDKADDNADFGDLYNLVK